MTALRDYIQHNPTTWLTDIVEHFKINVTRDGDLVSLKYNQIESPMDHPVVKQCRGTVVHVPTGRILAHPYDKFWNHGEPLAAPIDWSTARVMDKLDGSLMILYWDWFADRWRVASSGHPTAGGSYNGDCDETFGMAFWRIWNQTAMGVPDGGHRDICFMFELVSPRNRIVCKYDHDNLILHGARNMVTGKELGPDALDAIASWHGWASMLGIPAFGEGVRDIMDEAADRDPLKYEGFVVVDANFNRVKIKSPRYVRLHQLRDRTTPRAIIEAWQKGEESEILAHFPEMEADFRRVLNPIENAAILASDALWVHGGLESRKEFAERVKHLPYSAVCFRLYGTPRRRPEDALSVLREMSVSALERLSEAMR